MSTQTVFGAFFLVPGVGHVAVGGYLLYVADRPRAVMAPAPGTDGRR